jgi:hypothetical protein
MPYAPFAAKIQMAFVIAPRPVIKTLHRTYTRQLRHLLQIVASMQQHFALTRMVETDTGS